MGTYAHCRASQHAFVRIDLLFWAYLRVSGSLQDWEYKSSGPLGWHCRPSLEDSLYTVEMTLFLDVPHPTPTYINGNTLSSLSFRNGYLRYQVAYNLLLSDAAHSGSTAGFSESFRISLHQLHFPDKSGFFDTLFIPAFSSSPCLSCSPS